MDKDSTEAGISLAASGLLSQDFAEEIVIADGDVDNLVPDTSKKKSAAVTVYRLIKREEAEALGISLQEGSVANPNKSTTVITRQTINMNQRLPFLKVEQSAIELNASVEVEPMADSIRIDESNPKLRFGCGACPKRFRHLSHLRRHEKGHTGERPFACDECPKAFADASTLLRHSRTHSSTRAYSCHTCGKAFAAAGALRRHATVHDPAQRRYPCVACPKRFPDKAAYRKHLLTHGDVRPHACNYCEKRFFHVGDLNGHRKIHDLVKPYTCQHCHREFVKQSNYARHVQIHEGEKQFACHVCNVSYNYQASLTRHLLTHVSRNNTGPSSPHVLILHTDPSADGNKVTLSSIRRLLDANQMQMTDEALWNADEGVFEVQHPEAVAQFHETAGHEFHVTEAQELNQTKVQEVVEATEAVAQEVVYEIKVLDIGEGRLEIVTSR